MPVHHYPKPNAVISREIPVRGNYDAFEGDLIKWIATSVTHNTDKAEDLVCPVSGLEQFYAAVRNLSQMRVGSGVRIYAHIDWGRLPDGRWRASAVDFTTSASQRDISAVARRLETDRQLDLAETRNMKQRPDVRKMVFPAETHDSANLPFYIHSGADKLKECFKLVYNTAKEDAELPENPFESPLKDATSVRDVVVKTVVSHVPGEHGEDIAKVAEGYYTSKEATEAVAKQSIFSAAKMGAEHFAKDYLAEGAKTFADVPFLGFFELALGGMCDAAISGQAGRVAKIRSHGYVYFTYGFLSALTYQDTPNPRTAAEHKYYRGGENVVRKLMPSPLMQFYVQVALLHYAAENATGTWEFKLDPEEWSYPRDYIAKWSPQLLGRSLLTQLCQRKYLVD
jgi:hypothetical protein